MRTTGSNRPQATNCLARVKYLIAMRCLWWAKTTQLKSTSMHRFYSKAISISSLRKRCRRTLTFRGSRTSYPKDIKFRSWEAKKISFLRIAVIAPFNFRSCQLPLLTKSLTFKPNSTFIKPWGKEQISLEAKSPIKKFWSIKKELFPSQWLYCPLRSKSRGLPTYSITC